MPFLNDDMATTPSTTVEASMHQEVVEMVASAAGKACRGDRRSAQMLQVDENGVEYGSSRPPSPPSTGDTTPTLTIAPCPMRLWSFVPPPQYGVVEDYTIFRSSYPQARNLEFIKSLEVKSVLTLVATDPTPEYASWIEDFRINHAKVMVAPNKEAKEGKSASKTSLDSICEALLFVMDAANHPLWIHCNQGRHRTGCVVACLRKIQGTPLKDAILEYVAYANPKARDGDMEFIKSFKPSIVFDYAKKRGLIGGDDPQLKSVGPKPITNVYELAYALASHGRQDSASISDMESAIDSLSSGVSETSLNEPMDTRRSDIRSNIDPGLLAISSDARDEVQTGVSVVEVERDEVDDVETLALHGALDPNMDHENVATALA